jgi:hypothetical protein
MSAERSASSRAGGHQLGHVFNKRIVEWLVAQQQAKQDRAGDCVEQQLRVDRRRRLPGFGTAPSATCST